MEPGNRGEFNVNASGEIKPTKRTPKLFHKLKKIIKKFWYIFAAILILIAEVLPF